MRALDNVASVMETERLVLRLPRLDDAEALLEFVGDEEVMRRIGDEPGGREKAEAFVDRWIKRWERNGVGPFIVELERQLIGRVGLIVWDRRTWETSAYDLAGEHAQEELGWALVRQAWGYGYATEAAQAVKSWCHEQRRIERLVSLIAPDNVRSQRVAEKLGACLEERIETAVGPTDVWAYPHPGICSSGQIVRLSAS
jgi:RimJ/RimL family protein N-acetyltransferase